MSNEELKKCEYILWKDYGHEGWQPTPCIGKKELLEAIAETYGANYVITKNVLDVKVMVD